MSHCVNRLVKVFATVEGEKEDHCSLTCVFLTKGAVFQCSLFGQRLSFDDAVVYRLGLCKSGEISDAV